MIDPLAALAALSLLGAAVSPAWANVTGQAVAADSGGLAQAAHWIEQSGRWAYVLAPLFMCVVAILPIPAEIPALLNGMIFGPILGTVMSWSGAVVGAMISFELARAFGRPLAKRFLKASMIQRADEIVCAAHWQGLLILRLIPTVAFTAVNWSAGLSALKRRTFLWTTAVGILPGAALFTSSGSGLAALFRQRPALTVAGTVLAFAVVTWLVHRRLGSRAATPGTVA